MFSFLEFASSSSPGPDRMRKPLAWHESVCNMLKLIKNLPFLCAKGKRVNMQGQLTAVLNPRTSRTGSQTAGRFGQECPRFEGRRDNAAVVVTFVDTGDQNCC